MGVKVPVLTRGGRKGSGKVTAVVPDVLIKKQVPPIPVPNSNSAECGGAKDACQKVLVEHMPTFNVPTTMASSKEVPGVGDDGVMSGTKAKDVVFKEGFSAKVYACGKKLVTMLTGSSHNKDNAPKGTPTEAPQDVVLTS